MVFVSFEGRRPEVDTNSFRMKPRREFLKSRSMSPVNLFLGRTSEGLFCSYHRLVRGSRFELPRANVGHHVRSHTSFRHSSCARPVNPSHNTKSKTPCRMFSHPWTDQSSESGADRGQRPSVPDALKRVGLLNERLIERSRTLLAEAKGGKDYGSCEFNVALINRMEPSTDRPDLKLEPTFGQERCKYALVSSCLAVTSVYG